MFFHNRLLKSGGADVCDLTLPVKQPWRVADTVAYVFVSNTNIAAVTCLLAYGVLCIRPEFIADYLIMVSMKWTSTSIAQSHISAPQL